ncbi:putative ATPase/DNA-binding winged helix-turn-helix (wHTH) protein [Paraburkholderia bannensis]|uniref:Putative ATPase/DNA-binding winged helix-turn-helix (WHTH) protein n=1 Tax=Paraburkholderia bannensis TaxID=765414 RepID=A0A7W9U665_9BURK|nr:putative ATPase/DNA-binding winged helix-turn-helix (wHTH) protein [Paraburkholderia sp. WP4_3_2]MBB6106705.1 putative ATPase/DNA-binding winged helix-turn-helix (wHTH) protein [Paraburkholderia bannensis]
MELGNIQIDLQMRTLRRAGEVVRLSSRAFDILAVIVSADGRLVTKDELMTAVWPDTIVEENNIQVHLSALRKALGADRDLILTVPGRGYQLVHRKKADRPDVASAHGTGGRHLPPLRPGLLGRDAEVTMIRSMLMQAHVVTLVGAGGIGKTRLAIEAAHRSASEFTEPVCFVELAALTTQEAVLSAIAESCGLTAPCAQIDVTHLATMLAGKPKLLLLDNAEHVVGVLAQIVDALVVCNARLRVLVTSREPLRIMAENVFRVDPLDVPPPNSVEADIRRCSSVRLFLQRANSLRETVGTDASEIRLVGEICRRLDGIPLAIELAAARVVALGVEGVFRRLDDRMAILDGGYRTALPRHQTLRATFDWSFALLDPATQAVFRRLALFGNAFSFKSMCAAVCDQQITTANAIGAITDLVAKSLVNVEFEGAAARYRLSESTRAYALERLKAEGELREIITRNSRYLSRCLQTHAWSAKECVETGSSSLPHLQQILDDARSAFDWAYCAEGDPQAGLELALELTGALLDAGLVDECRTRAAQAITALQKQPPGTVDKTSELRLRAAVTAVLPELIEPLAKQPENAVRQRSTMPRETHAPGTAVTIMPAHFMTNL